MTRKRTYKIEKQRDEKEEKEKRNKKGKAMNENGQ